MHTSFLHFAALSPPADFTAGSAYDKSSLEQLVGDVLGVCVVAFSAQCGQLVYANESFKAAFVAQSADVLTHADLEFQFQHEGAPNRPRDAASHSVADTDQLHLPTGRWFNVRRCTAQYGSLGLIVLELTAPAMVIAEPASTAKPDAVPRFTVDWATACDCRPANATTKAEKIDVL